MVKDKRFICFAGRGHHYTQLIPIVTRLREQGARVQFLASDNSILNNDVAVSYLIPQQEDFIHSADFLGGQIDLVTSMTNDMLRTVDGGKLDYESDFRTYIEPFWWIGTFREVAEIIVSYRRILETQKPDMVILLHEANLWCKALACLCHSMGIPVISTQEGRLRHRDQKTMGKQRVAAEYSTRLLVWSPSDKQAYVDAGYESDKVVVTGIVHIDHIFRAMQQKDYHDRRRAYRLHLGFNPDLPLVMLSMPIMSRYEGNPVRAIGAVLDWSANRAAQVAVKFHPFEDESAVAKIANAIAEHPYAKLMQEGDRESLIASSDVVLCQHSTMGLIALALGSELVEIDFENVGILEGYAEQGRAHSIGAGELDKVLDILSGKETKKSPDLDSWLDENVGPRDGLATQRVVDVIEGILA